MNTIKASITKIDGIDSINLVSFQAEGERLVMMSLELDKALEVGSAVVLGFKASSVSLVREKNAMLSISNQIPVRIKSINNGELLSSVKLSFSDTVFESIITKDSLVRMGLKQDEEIVALIKASDLSIVKIA